MNDSRHDNAIQIAMAILMAILSGTGRVHSAPNTLLM